MFMVYKYEFQVADFPDFPRQINILVRKYIYHTLI